MQISFGSKVVLVTGGSRGIGAAAVRLFTGAGARVAFNYRSARETAVALASECGGPDRCRSFAADLNSAEAGKALVADALSAWNRLDALVVNHGVWPPHDQPIETMPESQWRGTMQTNLDSVFGLVSAAVAQMKRQRGGGQIVLVASTAAQRGEAFHADYAASKGALVSMTKGLATELAPHGIYVNCVAPGWVDTDMSAPALGTEAGRARIFSAIPLGRVGTAEEIAAPIVFLCTPWAGFITGEVLNVNGGAVLAG